MSKYIFKLSFQPIKIFIIMAKAEILTIGTEILLGEIVDTNSRYIARLLRDHGVDIFYLSTVGDNVERIAAAVQQGLARSEIIITTGGLGPTVDDPTREAVAQNRTAFLRFARPRRRGEASLRPTAPASALEAAACKRLRPAFIMAAAN